MNAQQWGAVAGSICILMAWSYLYKDNPLYAFAEHLFIGIVTARGITYTFENQLKPLVTTDIMKKGEWDLLIPAAIGLLIYTSFFKNYQWLSRITMGFWIGYSSGYFLAYNPDVYFGQVFDSFINLRNPQYFLGVHWNNLLYFAIIISTLMYFAFTLKKDRGLSKHAAQFGRYALMVAFGSAYGSITMAYLSLIIGKLEVILKDTLHLVK